MADAPPPPPRLPSPIPPAHAPKPGRSGWVTAIIIGVVVGTVGLGGCVALVAIGANEVSRQETERRESIRGEVELVDCGTDQFGFMNATVTVTNRSADRSNYLISVSFDSQDGAEQYGTGSAFVNGLNSGQSRTVEAGSLDRVSGEFVCLIDDVSRMSDEP